MLIGKQILADWGRREVPAWGGGHVEDWAKWQSFLEFFTKRLKIVLFLVPMFVKLWIWKCLEKFEFQFVVKLQKKEEIK